MFDEHGDAGERSGPSVPVEVLGLDDVPLAGDELRVAPSDKVARVVAEARAHRRKVAAQRNPMMFGGGARLEDIFEQVQRGEVATLNLIVKADVQGSLEALTDALRKLDQEHDEVRLVVRAPRCRWDHRIRLEPRRRFQRDGHRLQRASRPQGARSGRA